MNKDITVIVPAYNEEKGIENTLKQVFFDLPGAKIIVVDDCSHDGTKEVLTRVKRRYKDLEVITHRKNRGYGGALKTGFEHAKTDYIAFIDADMTYLPKYIPLLASEVKRNNLDCAWCNRFTKESKMPVIRKIGNKMLIGLFFVLTLRYIPDITSGERLFKKESLQRIEPKTLPDGLDMISAMSKRIIARRLKYKVIKCEYMQRDGQSKLNIITDFLRMTRNIIFEK